MKRHSRKGSISVLEERQRRLWDAALAICIVLFFVLSLWWIAIELGLAAQPDERTQTVMELADFTAICVFALELYARYRKTPDKMTFLRHNWLEIIVLLPIGMFFRLARGMARLEELGALAGAARLGNDGFLIPEIAATGRVAARVFEGFHNWLSYFHVIGDFFRMVWESLIGFFRRI